MKAVGLYRDLPIDHPESLLDLEIAAPVPQARDLLVEAGVLRTTVREHRRRIGAENLERAHRQRNQGRVVGKRVLEGF